MTILVAGSIAFDSIKTPFGERDMALGGAANFFSVSASLFTPIQLVGIIGEDFPENHLEYLRSKQVDTAGVQRVSGKTFHWRGNYGWDLNEAQTLQTDLNVLADFNPKLPEHFQNAETVFLANMDPVTQLQVLEQVKKPKLVAMDTMNLWIDIKPTELARIISKVDILFINEAELRQLAKERNTFKAVRKIQESGPKTLVVKRGEYGAMLFDKDTKFFVPAYPLEDLFDPTGAGDTFAAGFMSHAHKGYKEAMVMGTVMASFAIEDFSFDRIKNLDSNQISQRREEFLNLIR